MNSWIDQILNVAAPHICKGCGAAGATVCERCIFNINRQDFTNCVNCGRRTIQPSNLCKDCVKKLKFDQIFAVGWRRGVLQSLVDDFKFNSERASAKLIAQLLKQHLPDLPKGCAIVPIPTILPHIRQRGFDHAKLIAKELAKICQTKVEPNLLIRQNNIVQHELKAGQRKAAAKNAFSINPKIRIPENILLIDDIWTTGSTMVAAAELLKKSGVKTIIGAVVAVQPKK